MLPVVGLLLPAIALMRSNHTPVGWLAIALPPFAAAFARHCGLLYTVAPTYGLSTRPGPGFGFDAVRFTVIEVPVYVGRRGRERRGRRRGARRRRERHVHAL